MDVRRFHRTQARDGVFQLAFQSALIVHALIEFGADPVRLVEQLKAQPAALGAAFACCLQPRLVQVLDRHLQRCAVGRDIEGNLGRGQLVSQLSRIRRVKVGVEHAPTRLHDQRREYAPGKHNPGHHCEQGHTRPFGERRHPLMQTGERR